MKERIRPAKCLLNPDVRCLNKCPLFDRAGDPEDEIVRFFQENLQKLGSRQARARASEKLGGEREKCLNYPDFDARHILDKMEFVKK